MFFFLKLNRQNCVPSCTNCDKGTCVAPSVCKCYSGYAKNATNHCVPSCSSDCVNGICVDGDVCECKPGYRKVNDSPMAACEPICDPACVQGSCIGPNECDCFPGYQSREGAPNECLPICAFCEDNDCQMETDPCTCWESYEEQDITFGE